jgi:SAM-dependent methyltransferase
LRVIGLLRDGFALRLGNESNGGMSSPSDDHDDKSWLRVPLTDPVAVAERYDEWAASYDDELHAWGYEAPVQAARLIVAQLRGQLDAHGQAGGDVASGPEGSDTRRVDAVIEGVGGIVEGVGSVAARSGRSGVDDGVISGPVLDIGCGTGLTGLALHALGARVIDGVDLSEVSLAAAQSRGIYRNLQRHNFNESSLPFADDSYIAAECVGVLSYAHDPRSLIVDACRVVQSGGTVVFSQRSDLWAEHNLAGVLDDLCTEGIILTATWSEPQPYMPGNADFADQILVLYVTLTVA